MTGTDFYSAMPPLRLPVAEAFAEEHFREVPAGWHVVIADVRNSTAAVREGRHNDVNLVAAGSLVAALNVAREQRLEIPFFFGGDGGTLLVPDSILRPILQGLAAHNENSQKNFGLSMHIGSVPVAELRERGAVLRLSKLQHGPGFPKPVVVGDGLRQAEQQIKGAIPPEHPATLPADALNMNGLECRWDRIKPPAAENEVVCYLIECPDPAAQMRVYGAVLRKIDEIYGNLEQRQPLSAERLKLAVSFQKIRREMIARYGRWRPMYFTTAFIGTFLARIFLKHHLKAAAFKADDYLAQIITNADTLTIDGRINTIITGSREKRVAFLEYLAAEEEKGRLVFGHYISRESVMTCYIENRDPRHIHFVDGADGGYTEAARELKSKLGK